VEHQERTVNYAPPTVESKRSPQTQTYFSTARIDATFHRKSAFLGSWHLSVPRQRRKSPQNDSTAGSVKRLHRLLRYLESGVCQQRNTGRSHMRTVWAIPLLTSRPTWARTSHNQHIVSTTRFGYYFQNYTIWLPHRRRAHSLEPTALMGYRRFRATLPFATAIDRVFNAAQNQNDTQRNADKANPV